MFLGLFNIPSVTIATLLFLKFANSNVMYFDGPVRLPSAELGVVVLELPVCLCILGKPVCHLYMSVLVSEDLTLSTRVASNCSVPIFGIVLLNFASVLKITF